MAPELLACAAPPLRRLQLQLPLTLRAELPGVTQDFEHSRVKPGIRGFEHPGQVRFVDDLDAVLVGQLLGLARVAAEGDEQPVPDGREPLLSSSLNVQDSAQYRLKF